MLLLQMDASGMVHDGSMISEGSVAQRLDRYTRMDDGQIQTQRLKTPYGTFMGRNGCKLLENEDSIHDVSTGSSVLDVSLSDTQISEVSSRTLQTRYEAESPDELALVQAACAYGCRMVQRTPDYATVWLPGEIGTLNFRRPLLGLHHCRATVCLALHKTDYLCFYTISTTFIPSPTHLQNMSFSSIFLSSLTVQPSYYLYLDWYSF